MNDPKTKDNIENIRKSYIIVSMFIVGILLLIYKSNAEGWQDNFGTYTTTVVAVCAIFAIIGLLLMVMDLRKFLRHEMLGFILTIVAAIIMLIYPAAPALDISIGFSVMALGIIIAIVGGVILARYGGYLSPAIVGLGCQIAFAGYYPLMNPDASIVHDNALVASNIGVGFLIMSFVLMIYQDLKFYYLTNLIKNANRLRKEKKYNEALKYCDQALLIYPLFVTALNNKGNILFNLKKPKEAIEYYNKAIDINPSYKQAQSNLEVVKRKIGRATS